MRQEELDRYEGFWISPDGGMVAYEEVTEAHIPQSLEGWRRCLPESMKIGFRRRIEKTGMGNKKQFGNCKT